LKLEGQRPIFCHEFTKKNLKKFSGAFKRLGWFLKTEQLLKSLQLKHFLINVALGRHDIQQSNTQHNGIKFDAEPSDYTHKH
jgi:hypothetical protein